MFSWVLDLFLAKDLIFIIIWCSICVDIAVAVLGRRNPEIYGVRGDKKHLQPKGWRAVNILNKPAIFRKL